ncbi:unnamed protein product [Clonostachys solani]|uniref:3',5'-cyclic-nucleotide phosphodiesterase n=1 Tax=Clonostachys solani TaxID=160281 RepID=A0A9N9Z4M3_9HYPO|nr:unnamed protein product [Clonostachys solani]
MRDSRDPALQVIVLGSGGGPQESNTTALLVRSVAQEWRKGSIVAVDAGVHLSAITRLVKESLPSPVPSLPHTLTSGPFAGLSLPFHNADTNAQHISSSLVDAYLITHPHLDHISAFVINTAGPPGARPKKLAGLPNTIHAFKTHIFNNVIWPNLSDENNGAGLVTYLRLVEGGSPALGDGEGKGYSEICDGLLVKIWGVSHGHCIEKHSHRGSASSASGGFINHDLLSQTPRRDPYSHAASQTTPRRQSLLSQATFGAGAASPSAEQEKVCVYDSSAYFIQDQDHRREVLIFGDVEPDSLSLSPRNLQIWQDAAPKIVAGNLAAIFIECSYDDSRSNDRLFGHLKPEFIIEELLVLAVEVDSARKYQHVAESKKRKRMSDPGIRHRGGPKQYLTAVTPASEDPLSPRAVEDPAGFPGSLNTGLDTPHIATPTTELSLHEIDLVVAPSPSMPDPRKQLEGLKVIIMHIKDRLTDGPDVGEMILNELQEYEREVQLGCEFIIAHSGQSFYF